MNLRQQIEVAIANGKMTPAAYEEAGFVVLMAPGHHTYGFMFYCISLCLIGS